jgi:beta-ketodecanoyl-[acyl-carrier-protein] synthase
MSIKDVVISGSGFYAPEDVISNEELVSIFNQYAQQHGLPESSDAFIVKASGIKRRHVLNKKGILDIDTMRGEAPPAQVDMALKAVAIALKQAKKDPKEIDLVICSSSAQERFFPCMAIEIQNAFGMPGYAFDMQAACSSATFGIDAAAALVQSGQANAALVVISEACTPHINFRDRDSHFIFGDAAAVAIVERKDTCKNPEAFEIISRKLFTQFSNNITQTPKGDFTQQGRVVFKEIVPLVPQFILKHLSENNLTSQDIKRYWLHQANINMNNLIAQKILGREPSSEEAPIILDEYANTGGAGSLIAFHLYQQELASQDLCLLSSFGAGYSIGSIILKKV